MNRRASKEIRHRRPHAVDRWFRGEDASAPSHERVRLLRFADVLGPRTLRALPGLERHGLTLTERRERLARRLMKKVLMPRLIGDEAEALVRNDTLDGALRCHVIPPVPLTEKRPSGRDTENPAPLSP